MPGTYTLSMRLNDHGISDQDITFVERTRDDQLVVEACLTPEQVDLLGLREDALKMIQWLDGSRCADFTALEGIVLRGDLSESSLQVSVPQAWLEYQDASRYPFPAGKTVFPVCCLITTSTRTSRFRGAAIRARVPALAGPPGLTLVRGA